MTSPDARKKDEVAWAAGSSGAGLAGCWRIAERKRNKIQRKVLTVYTYSVLDSAIVLPSVLFIYFFIYLYHVFFLFFLYISGCCRSPVLVGRDQEHDEDPTYTNRTTRGFRENT